MRIDIEERWRDVVGSRGVAKQLRILLWCGTFARGYTGRVMDECKVVWGVPGCDKVYVYVEEGADNRERQK